MTDPDPEAAMHDEWGCPQMAPGSPEWLRVITASKVASVLGHSPYDSPRSLWHRMRGDLPREESTSVQRRGHYLEDGVLAWWRDQHPEYQSWVTQPQYRLGDWAAATPDMAAAIGSRAMRDTGQPGLLLVEAKTARDAAEWGDPGTDTIPAHYLTQCYWQMHVSGVHECRVAVLLPFLDFAEYVIRYDSGVGELLERRCRDFYDSLADGEPPPLDDTTATVQALKRLNPLVDKGVSVEIDDGLAQEYLTAKDDEKDAQKRLNLAQSRIYETAGTAQYVTCRGVRVARRQANKSGVASLVRVAKTIALEQE